LQHLPNIWGDSQIGKWRHPRSKVDIVLRRAVFGWAVAGFEHKPYQKSRTLIARNREADSIAIALDGEA